MRWLLCIALMVGLSGCVIAIPQGWHTVSGSNHPKQEIAFLDLPGATRDETVATLGTPSWESREARVLVYLWQANYTWQVNPPEPIHPSIVETDFRDWGLFIAYDEQGHLVGHEKRWVTTRDLEAACAGWANTRKNLSIK